MVQRFKAFVKQPKSIYVSTEVESQQETKFSRFSGAVGAINCRYERGLRRASDFVGTDGSPALYRTLDPLPSLGRPGLGLTENLWL